MGLIPTHSAVTLVGTTTDGTSISGWQANQVKLIVDDVPAGSWAWTTTSTGAFDTNGGTLDITATPGADSKEATLTLTNVLDSDVTGGLDTQVSFDLFDGTSTVSVTADVSVRALRVGFTLMERQAGGDAALTKAGADGFTITPFDTNWPVKVHFGAASGFTSGDVGVFAVFKENSVVVARGEIVTFHSNVEIDVKMTAGVFLAGQTVENETNSFITGDISSIDYSFDVDPFGRVTRCEPFGAAFDEDTTFGLRLKDGTRQASVVEGIDLSLRRIGRDVGFCLLEGQSGGDAAASAAGVSGFVISPYDTEWPVAVHFGAASGFSAGDVGSFAVFKEHGTAVSRGEIVGFTSATEIEVKMMVGVFLAGQTIENETNGFITGDVSSVDYSFTFDDMGRVAACSPSGASFDEDTTFGLHVKDGARPGARVEGINLKLRRVADGFTLFEGQTGGDASLSAPGGKNGFTVCPFDTSWPVTVHFGAASGFTAGDVGAFAVFKEHGTVVSRGEIVGFTSATEIEVKMTAGVFLAGQTIENEASSFITGDVSQVDYSFTFDDAGRVTGCSPSGAAFDEDTSFGLHVQDGTCPGAYRTGLPLSLRKLTCDRYALFAGQVGGGPSVNAAGASGLVISPYDTEWPVKVHFGAASGFTAGDVGVFLVFKEHDTVVARGEITGFTSATEIEVKMTAGVFLAGQTIENEASALITGDVSSVDYSFGFNAMGQVTACAPAGATFHEDTTLGLHLKDGSRPGARLEGIALSCRQVTPASLSVVDLVTPTAGNQAFPVDGDADTWLWSGYGFFKDAGRPDQTFDFTDTDAGPTTSGLEVKWDTANLTGPGTGKLVADVTRADAGPTLLAPSSTIEIPVSVDAQLGINGDSEFTVLAARRAGGIKKQDNSVEISFFDPGDWNFSLEGTYGNLKVVKAGPQTARLDLTDVTATDFDNHPNYEFDVRLVGGPAYTIKVSLRLLEAIDFYHFGAFQVDQGVVSINAAPGSSGDYAWSDNGHTAVTLTPSGTNDIQASVVVTDGSVGTNETFTLSIADGSRPASNLLGATVTRLALDPASLTIEDDNLSNDQAAITVVGNGDSWLWSSYGFTPHTGQPAQTFTFPGSYTNPITTGLVAEWDTSNLTSPGTGAIEATVTRADTTADPLAPWCKVGLDVAVEPQVNEFDLVSVNGDHVLPTAREKMRYSTVLTATSASDDPVTFELHSHQTILELYEDPSLGPKQVVLRTIEEPSGNLVFLPNGTGGTTQTITVSASQNADNAVIDFTADIVDTKDDIDTAILLDRSGSMRGSRWAAAYSGAQAYAALVKGVEPDLALNPHNVGLYWFNGNCSDRHHDHTTYPEGQYWGTFDVDSSDYSIATRKALEESDQIDDVCSLPENSPTRCTGIAAGLVHAKDEIKASANEKVILALSDGMENCDPRLLDVFPDGATSTYWADGGEIRIYSVAVLTLENWADLLRGISAKTGGSPATDVKHIVPGTSPTLTNDQIQQWFINSFKVLFGFSSPTMLPDPDLAGGHWETHPVTINMGISKAVFYCLFTEKDDGKWTFGVIPPGQDAAIYSDDTDAYDGVHCAAGKQHRLLFVDLPLAISGHEHRWAGEWKMVIGRKDGAPTRAYAAGALTRQDLGSGVHLLAPYAPKTGDTASIVVKLVDQNDKPINQANVEAVVHHPGTWIGHAVSMELAHSPKLVKALRRSTSQASIDTDDIGDRLLRELYERGKLDDGKTTKISLEKVGNKGLYRAEVPLTRPGQYAFDVVAEGLRKTPTAEIKDKIGDAKVALKSYYTVGALKDEKAYLKEHAGTKQAFRLEHRDQLAVGFLPDAKKTEVQGYFVNESTIRFRVQPRDKADTMLGPGWSKGVEFHAPGVEAPWPALDAGDSSYWVDIPFKAKNPRLHRRRNTLVADRLRLRHPLDGLVSPSNQELPLEGFKVTVLGVEVPITVYALVGNRRSKETHLASCVHAAKIGEKNKVFIHDLNEARRSGYDTCEWCLPLICNTSAGHMEAHKPFCGHVKHIARKNRLEVHSWRQAKKLKFDGCAHCLPEYHKR